MNLLLVEDNKKMRELMKGLFSSYFEAIFECADGIPALEMYALHEPEWVFMDIKMGVMDGIRATREIKRRHPDAKIIIVTDYNDRALRAEAAEAGAAAYVLKENLTEIFDIIKK